MGYFCYILMPMAGIDRVAGVDPYGAKETIFYDNFETYACILLHILSVMLPLKLRSEC